MPFYDYRCASCKNRFEVFIRYKDLDKATVLCPVCESDRVVRTINRVALGRSEESRLENMVDPAQLEGIDENPESLGRLMRKMENAMGEDMGDEFDEVVSRLETGQKPEQIEQEMPNLGRPASLPGDQDSET